MCQLNHTISTVQQSPNSATLGVKRDEIKTFYKSPHRPNVYQQIRHVKEISTRWIHEQIVCSSKYVLVSHLLICESQGIVTNLLVSSWHWLPQGGRCRCAEFWWLFVLLFWMNSMHWTIFSRSFATRWTPWTKHVRLTFDKQISWTSLFWGEGGGGPK